jgi:hypothetical protein
MTKSKTKLSILTAMLFALLVVVAAPGTSFAQGDNHDRGRGQGQRSKWQKKHDKFVNGHDARDGRWDGRGPARRNAIVRNRVYRNGVLVPTGTRVWNRNRVLNTNDLRLRNERARLRLAQRRAWLRRNR